MPQFHTPVPPRLTIDLRAGTIVIESADTPQTSIDLRPRRDSGAARDLVEATTIEQRGDEVVVLAPERLRFMGRSTELDLRATVPHGTRLFVETGSAGVRASGRFGESTIDTGSGDVTVGDVDGPASLRSGSGDLHVAAIAGDAEVQTGSGDVAIGSVAGEATVKSGSGDVSVDRAGTRLDVKTGSGDVAVGDAAADLRVTTASGEIRLERVAAGEVAARAVSGDIRAGVRAGTAAWLDVRSVSGRVTSTLDSAGEPGPDEQRVRLALQTVSGDIEIARA